MAHELSRLKLDHPLWIIRAEFGETGSGRGYRWYEASRGGDGLKDAAGRPFPQVSDHVTDRGTRI